MKNLKNLSKRGLSVLLALVMCLGMLNLTAFAANGTKDQVVDPGESGVEIGDGVVLSKTIEADPKAENYFDITLQVQTPKTVEQIILEQDIDVVLVMDISNTMNSTITNGSVSRYAESMEAMGTFMNLFAADSEGTHANRRIGVVGFNTDAHKFSDLVPCTTSAQASSLWTNVHNQAFPILDNSDYKKQKLHTRFTNMEAGLKMASDMLKDSTSEHKYIIFLTDGFPTTYLQRNNNGTIKSGYKGYDPYMDTPYYSGTRAENVDGYFLDGKPGNANSNKKRECTYGTSYSDTAADYAQKMATSIKNSGVTIYSVGVDVKGQTVKQYVEGVRSDGQTYKEITFSVVETRNQAGSGNTQFVIGYDQESDFTNWLRDSIGSEEYYDSNDADLTTHFKSIFKSIETQIRNEVEASWVTTDPIPNYIDFQSFYPADNNGTNRVTFQGNKITWNLPQSSYTTKTIGNTTTYTYTLKYRVRLETEKGRFVHGDSYKTNGDAKLTYKVVENGKPSGDKSGMFPVPQVKGYLGSFSFIKEAYGKPLDGANFTLMHNDGCAVCKAGGDNIGKWSEAVSSRNGGAVSFTNIPSGHEYTLRETSAPDGYEKTSETWKVTVAYGETTIEPGSNGTVINPKGDSTVDNKKLPKEVPITVTKNWQNDMEGFRPTDLTVTLIGTIPNGTKVQNVTISGSDWRKNGNVWTATKSVPSVDVTSGENITYKVEETVPAGYKWVEEAQNLTVTPNGSAQSVTLNNQLDKTVTVTVDKKWVDPEGTAHSPVKVTLYGNGEVVAGNVTLNEGNNWSHTFVNLPAYDSSGKANNYHVVETPVNGYTTTTEKVGDTWVITNTIVQEYLRISGTKQWKGDIPEELQDVTLTGTVNGRTVYTDTVKMGEGNVSFAFTSAPKYDVPKLEDGVNFPETAKYDSTNTGALITYTVSDNVKGFTVYQQSATVEPGKENSVTLVNTRDDIDAKIDITATKNWNDQTNANGTRTGNEIFVLQKLVGTEWVDVDTWNISGIYDEISGDVTDEGDGNTLSEPTTPTEPTPSPSAEPTTPTEPTSSPSAEPTTPTEPTPSPSAEPTTPPEPTPSPSAEPTTPPEPTPSPSAEPTPAPTPEPTKVINNHVIARFSGLPKYDQETGKLIEYRVVERDVNETVYPGAKDAVGVVNPDNNYTTTITNTLNGDETSITVTKSWKDNYSGRDSKEGRPMATITLTGTVNGAVDETLTRTWTCDGSADTQSYTFGGVEDEQGPLPVYKNGYKIVWKAEETEVPNGYTLTTGNDGFAFTNTITQVHRNVTVQKVWNWEGSASLPEIELVLKRADGSTEETVATITNTDLDGNLSKTWTNLDVYNLKTGHAWVYTVTETAITKDGADFSDRFDITYDPAGGSTALDGDVTLTVTNTFNPRKVIVEGDKIWYTPNNAAPTQEEIAAVVITLGRSNGELPEGIQTTAALQIEEKDGGIRYFYQFEDLPKYDAVTGEEIAYTVEETGIPAGFESTVADDGRTIFNRSKTLDETVVVRISKTWVGPVESRPESVTAVISGSDGSTHELVLTAENGWTGSITLPKYDAVTRNKITYTKVEEQGAVEGQIVLGDLEYDVEVENTGSQSWVIANTLSHNEEITVSGRKDWTGAPEEFELPEIKVQLYIDGRPAEDGLRTLSTENGWDFNYGAFPKYALEGNGVVDAKDGHLIKYEVRELGVDESGLIRFVFDGKDYVFEASQTAEDGTIVLTNAYKETVPYYFELETWYVTHFSSGAPDVIDGSLIRVEKTEEKKDAEITAGGLMSRFPASQWTEFDGKVYTFDADNDGNVVSVKLEKAGEVYKLVLWYERTVYPSYDPDPTPTPRPTPTPGPEPTPTPTPGPTPEPTPGPGPSPEPMPPQDIPNENVPLANEPDTQIPDDDVPLAALPEEPLVEIPEEEVPLANAPETGDGSGHWGLAALLAGAGLAWLGLFGRKRKEKDAP